MADYARNFPYYAMPAIPEYASYVALKYSMYLILDTQLHAHCKDEVTSKQSNGQVEVDKVVHCHEKLFPASKWNQVSDMHAVHPWGTNAPK